MTDTFLTGKPHWRIVRMGHNRARDGSTALLAIPAPHDKTWIEELGRPLIDSWEFCESIRLYITGDTSHPLVAKFGWGKQPRAVQH